jgi:hypothetical protein
VVLDIENHSDQIDLLSGVAAGEEPWWRTDNVIVLSTGGDGAPIV